MCCGQHRHHGGCREDVPAWEEPRTRRWGAGYGPPPWVGTGSEPEFGPAWWQLGKAERKEWLEAFKKHLEARLADVSEEIAKMGQG